MTTHCTARLAWHENGWNGKFCKDPKANVYCVGPYSYLKTSIRENRDLSYEIEVAGEKCPIIDDIKKIPPCIYSCNAFGLESVSAYSEPPLWFEIRKTKFWELPPATCCTWPFEGMYSDDVKRAAKGTGQTYSYDQRFKNAKNHFDQLTPLKSLIFYYANYSNPFSTEESQRYVLIGVARLKKIGDFMFFDDVSKRDAEKHAGGFVWHRTLTSSYPDEGFCIPYHIYKDNPEIINKILLTPDNPNICKYYTKHVTDDQAIDLLERFSEVCTNLIEIGDITENWEQRREWINKCIAELWLERGPYPGLLRILSFIGFSEAIPWYKQESQAGNHISAKELIFSFLNQKIKEISSLKINEPEKILRRWKLTDEIKRRLLETILPRFDLTIEQIQKILSEERDKNSILDGLQDILNNPYIISESYIGDSSQDIIPFSSIDHGMIPAAHIGVDSLVDPDDGLRFRALVVDRLKKESIHSFLPQDIILSSINRKLKNFGEGRVCTFHKTYFEVDRELLEKKLVFRSYENEDYVYLKEVYDTERLIQNTVKEISIRPDITLRAPVTLEKWKALLQDPASPIYAHNPEDYDKIITNQSEVCSKIFQKPLSVIIGAAGTGKTTIIKAIIQAIEQTQGKGTSFLLLAPTGKAADRLREQTNKNAQTIHSFLAQNEWLNDNFTIRLSGGRQETGISTYIIDESSMLDLELAGGLFRAINWNSVQRLIFVGDPNQLPPIGRGKLFVEIIDWLNKHNDASVGKLTENIRQRVNALTDSGTTILEVAQLFIRATEDEEKRILKTRAEDVFPKIAQGGDIDKDFRVIFWNNYEELEESIKNTFIEDISRLANKNPENNSIEQIWTEAITTNGIKKADTHQIISPNRGDLHGTEYINEVMQILLHEKYLMKPGSLGSITINDKVIQFVNRPKSKPYYAYNLKKQCNEKIEVYNGEIGFVRPLFGNYRDMYKKHLSGFQVIFSRKPDYAIDFKGDTPVTENIELAYAISVHKAQGSEFNNVYLIIPKKISRLMSPELLYTGLTRASNHLTLFIEKDISPLQSLFRCENSQINRINSSIFSFQPIPVEFIEREGWYEEGKIHITLARYMVRSKSEVIIANILHQRNIPFFYEKPLYAPDGSCFLPDFTINWQGQTFYLEHLGLLDKSDYQERWNKKQKWYDKWYPGQLLTLTESPDLSIEIESLVDKFFPAPIITEEEPEQKWIELIKQGESTTLEFKSSLRWDYKQKTINKELKHEILKTIGAFLNSDGGILFIGVDDQGEVLGLDNDYKTLGKRQDRDGFLQSIDASINEHLRRDTHANVQKEIIHLEDKEICIITVKPSNSPVFLEYGNDEEFYIRGAVSSIRLKSREQFEYIKKRFE